MAAPEDEGTPRKGSWTDWVPTSSAQESPAQIGEHGLLNPAAFSGYETGMAFTIAVFVIILAALMLYAQYSGAVRWILAIVVLAVLALFLVRLVLKRTSEPQSLGLPSRPDVTMTGGLRGLAETFDRASGGMKYSQMMFSVRLKDAYLEKVRAMRGLTREELRRIRSDPAALFDVIGDRDIVVFLVETERNARDWSRIAAFMPPIKGYAQATEAILAKMEAWS